MTSLAEQFDALLLDLDGTVYLGLQPIEYVTETLAEAEHLGSRCVYITNNASRPPADVAAQLRAMGLAAEPGDILTSPQAAAQLLLERHPAGAKVLVVGAPALADEVAAVGLVPVREAAQNPVAVVQGHSPETGWPILAEACIALRAGADWVAANVDSTLPTDRGLLPGNGAMVAALVTATGLRPRVAGKPQRTLIDTAITRLGVHRPLVVGDRLDTDIAAGVAAEVPSLLVFTGVSTPADLLAAPAEQRPSYLGFDLRSVVEEARVVEVASGGDGWRLDPGDDAVTLTRLPRPGAVESAEAATDAADLHAVALLARHCWRSGSVPLFTPGDERAEQALSRLGVGVPAPVG